MKKYITSDFDVTMYEIEDIFTASATADEKVMFGPFDPDDN